MVIICPSSYQVGETLSAYRTTNTTAGNRHYVTGATLINENQTHQILFSLLLHIHVMCSFKLMMKSLMRVLRRSDRHQLVRRAACGIRGNGPTACFPTLVYKYPCVALVVATLVYMVDLTTLLQENSCVRVACELRCLISYSRTYTMYDITVKVHSFWRSVFVACGW